MLYIFLAAFMLGQACKDNDLVECDLCIVFLFLCSCICVSLYLNFLRFCISVFLYFCILAAPMLGQTYNNNHLVEWNICIEENLTHVVKIQI